MNLAVIPARGGSKRIVRKNIRHFHGKPIIAYSIQAALDSRLFDQVLVSTDDEEIAEVAANFGANVPFRRPAELSDDYTGTLPVLQHALRWGQDQGISVNMLACLYPAAPLVNADLLQQAERLRQASGADYCFTVGRFPTPIQRALCKNEQGRLEPMYPQCRETRTQDFTPAYFDAGMFYLGRAQAFMDGLPLHSPHAVGLELPRHLVQDIDTEEDWAFAEKLYTLIKQSDL